MIRTFIDSGVLIAAARGKGEIADRAMTILDDPNRQFLSSEFVKIEVRPKAIYNKRSNEAAFYAVFFNSVETYPQSSEQILRSGYEIACKFGLAAMDALHVAAAILWKADELITTETVDKPIHRIDRIKVVTIHQPAKRST